MNPMVWAVIILAILAVVLAVIIIRLVELGNTERGVWAKERQDYINRIMSVDYVRYYATKPAAGTGKIENPWPETPPYTPWTDESLAGTVQVGMPEWKEDAFKE